MNTLNRLRVVSFLQFFIWGSWLATIASYLFNTLHFTGGDIGLIFSSLGIASLITPVITGIIADKINNTKLVYISLHILSGIALIFMAHSTTVHLLFLTTLIHLIFYMPSISMCNSMILQMLAKDHLDPDIYFPKVRVMGTLGFIIAMWTISILKLETSYMQLYLAALSSLVLVCFSLLLPVIHKSTTITKEPAPFKIKEAIVVFSKINIVIFLVFAMLLGSVLQITNTLGVPFLQDMANRPEATGSFWATYPTIFLSISQLSEILFILLLPLLLKRVKIELILLMSMMAWIIRFGLFALGDFSSAGVLILLLSMLVYGCAFDFFNISGSLFLEKEIPLQYRSTAQGVFMTLVNGFGTFLGATLSGWVIDMNTVNGVIDWHAFWFFFTAYTAIFTAIYIALMFLLKQFLGSNKLRPQKLNP